MKISRRNLLFAAGITPAALLAHRFAWAEAAPRAKTLVCVFLRGAMDGLSAVVPYAEDSYYRDRKAIAIAENKLMKLDDRFGFHPALAPLMPAWKAGQLAPIVAVGSPHPTRSHFEAQDHFEWGGMSGSGGGWLARAQKSRGKSASNLSSVALARTTPLAFRGEPGVVAAQRLSQVGLKGPPAVRDRLESAFAKMYGTEGDAIGRAGTDALAVAKRLRQLDAKGNDGKYPGPVKGLADIATLIRANVGLEVAWIDTTGWDTHTGQAGRLNRNLELLGKGLAAFREDLGDRLESTLVLVMTEFGRTVKENGTGGTDHGHGSVMLALGGGVNGNKVLGKWPGLAAAQRYEGRDLAVTTDYRDVFAEVLDKQLGVSNPKAVLTDHTPGPGVGLLR